jgi:uncharacterized protein (TIGR02611 family)
MALRKAYAERSVAESSGRDESQPRPGRLNAVVEAAGRRFHAVRSFVLRWPGGHLTWRIGIAVLGLVVILAGVVMLILPGPGWVTIFVGFGIWATEFAWANSLLASLRRKLGGWAAWVKKRFR